jgi:DNA-binding HxlR family transcriptional regulator
MEALMSPQPPFPRARIAPDALEATVDELLALARQRGESLRQSHPNHAEKEPRDAPDIAALIRKDLLEVLRPEARRRGDQATPSVMGRPRPPSKRHPYHQWAPDARALDLVGDRWTLLIIRDLASGPRRFVELQRVLPGISTEQLRSRLNRMVADDLLTRRRYREVPPRVDYELTSRSRELLPVLGALARWGYQWVWSPPREGEAIDIGAIIRLWPALSQPIDANGTVELGIRQPDGTLDTYTLMAINGRLQLVEQEARDPAARVFGTAAEWIQALSPHGALDSLTVTGDRSLVELLLAALLRMSTQPSGHGSATPSTPRPRD